MKPKDSNEKKNGNDRKSAGRIVPAFALTSRGVACGKLHNQPAIRNRLRCKKAIGGAVCWLLLWYRDFSATTTNRKNKTLKNKPFPVQITALTVEHQHKKPRLTAKNAKENSMKRPTKLIAT